LSLKGLVSKAGAILAAVMAGVRGTDAAAPQQRSVPALTVPIGGGPGLVMLDPRLMNRAQRRAFQRTHGPKRSKWGSFAARVA